MIPDASIDFAFSNAVLEHVRKREFGPIVKEICRVLKPRGVTSHQIDFRDHLQYALNNLRFSERTWESEFMANSGFYTNRLSWAHMKSVFEASGFAVQSERLSQWDKLPTPRSAMAPEFRDVPLEELLVMDCHAVLTPI
jgi:ubiquinone/menaquinone biosynthesis C-methylase UbiE